jgi:hypothetical protein
MATSLINVSTQANPRGLNYLAQDADGLTAMENAIAAGVAAGDTLISASEVGGRPVDEIIPSAVAPAVDGTPKALYQVTFQPGSGAGSTTPSQLLILAWPQTNGGVVTLAAVLAAQAAVTAASATVSQIYQLGQVDVDTTAAAGIVTGGTGGAVGKNTGPVVLTGLAFRQLLTFPELLGIDNFATSGLTAVQKNSINTLMLTFQAEEDSIVLADPNTIAYVNYLESCALLTAARAAQVLADTPYLTGVAPAITGTHAVAIAPVTCTASGGSGAGYSFSNAAGAAGLPAGLAISAAGVITGTVAAAAQYTYTVNITDSAGDLATASGTISIT